MKCWFSEKDAKGACAACGRGLCTDHADLRDEMTLSKSDTSTGYASVYKRAQMFRLPPAVDQLQVHERTVYPVLRFLS